MILSDLPLSLTVLIQAIIILICVFLLYRLFQAHRIHLSKMHLESTFDSIDDPLAIVDTRYRLVRVNKAYSTLVKCDFKEVLGQRCYEVLRKRQTPCEDCRLNKVLLTGRREYLARSPYMKKAEKRTLSFTFYPFLENVRTPKAVVEHIRDITQLEYLKENLENQNRVLTDTTTILRQAQKEMNEELSVARQVQQSTLPQAPPMFPGLRFALKYHPIEAVGGDIYDFIPFSNDQLGIFIGDASGHGLSSALVSTISKMSLYNNSKTEMSTNGLLEKLNNDLLGNVRTSHYLTCFWGIFDARDKSFTYSRAGHPMPIVVRATGEICLLNGIGTFTGVLDDPLYEQKRFFLEKGDRCYLCTDGVFEVMENDDSDTPRILGFSKFVDIVASVNHLPFDDLIPSIEEKLSGFRYEDDYTLVVFECTEDHTRDLSQNLPGLTPKDDITYLALEKQSDLGRYIETFTCALTQNGFNRTEVQRMTLCVNELVANAFDHGNRNRPGKQVVFSFAVTRDRTIVSVVDEGIGFDIRGLPDPTHRMNLEREHGRGIFLVRNYVDEVGQNERGNGVYFVRNNPAKA